MSDLSPTLGINERVAELRAGGAAIHHLGFGESPFPAPPRLVEALAAHAGATEYLPVAGLPALREAVAAHQARLTGHDPADFDVLIGPGSKALLFAIQMAIPGDLLLPVPSWVSYAPQAGLLGQRVLPVATTLDDGGYRLDPEALSGAIASARGAGREPTKLLVNFPNNPAGLTIDGALVEALAEVCRREGVALVSDEIYGRVAYDGRYRSAGPVFPEGAIVTTGLSKHLSLGGWRLGVALVPKARAGLFDALSRIASETWSCVAAPVQRAAVEAYAGHADVEAHIGDCTAIHALVNRRLAGGLRDLGVDCPMPQGGFYSWPDFGARLGHRYESSAKLARALFDEARIAALPAAAFGEADARLALRLAACDYDGAAALERFRALPGSARSAPGLAGELAPGIDAALDAFERFLDARASSAAATVRPIASPECPAIATPEPR